MRNYEFTLIIRSGKVDEGKAALKDIFSKCGVTVESEDDWGPRKLAYAIDEEKEGYYVFNILQANPDAVAKVQGLLRLNNIFLRFMFVVLNKKSA